MDFEGFERRKSDHLRHSLDSAHQAGFNGLDRIQLHHESLPELDFSEVSLESTRFGKAASSPFFISGMTAGHSRAYEFNARFAKACASRGWGFGLGSNRRDLYSIQNESAISKQDQNGNYDQWSELRRQNPKLQIYANIGVSQLIRAKSQDIRALLDRTQANALFIHLNALQEVLQPEGTPEFRGALEAVARVQEDLELPVCLKETGCGFSARTLQRVRELSLGALDVSGFGGTHWGRIEGARSEKGSHHERASHVFANWGVSTAQSVLNAVELKAAREVWGSGGVRNGLDAAKLLALGVTQVGFAKPALEALVNDELESWMENMEFQLRVALFCTGTRSPIELRQRGKEVYQLVSKSSSDQQQTGDLQ